jgi:ABC-type transporter Mla subunit MlaD
MEHILRIGEAFIPPASGWVVAFLIIVVALWACWSLWCEYRRLRIERNENLSAARRVVEQSNEDELRERLEEWATRSELRDTLTARAIGAVLAMHQARNPDMEAILTMLDYSEAARLNLARSTPNWLLLLGIGGTVIGLASAIIELAPQIQATVGAIDPGRASQSMAEALEAMRHAFACSLWGIVTAVVVSLGTRKVISEQQQTVAAVQEWVLSEVASKLLPKSEATQLTEIQRTLRAGRQFLQGVTDLMSQAADRFNNVLVDTVQRMEGIGTSLHQSARDIQQTLLQASDSVQQSTRSLQESAKSLIASSEGLREYHQDLRNAHESLVRLFDKSRQELEDIITRQIERIAEYRAAMEQLSRDVVQRLIDISSDLRDSSARFTEAHQNVLQAFREVRDTIQSAFQNLQSNLEGILREHRDEMVRVEGRLREIATTLIDLAANRDTQAREYTARSMPRGMPSRDTNVASQAAPSSIMENQVQQIHDPSSSPTPSAVVQSVYEPERRYTGGVPQENADDQPENGLRKFLHSLWPFGRR